MQRLNKTRVFVFNIAPFFVFLSPKMEVRLIFDSKKAISNFKKGSFELQKSLFRTSKEPYLIMGRMLLKLRHDVAVTASGRSYCYVVTKLLLRRDVISPASLAE